MTRRVALIAWHCLIDVFRHKVVSIHLIFVLIAAGLFNLFAHFSTSPTLEYRMIQDVGISVISVFGLLMTLFIGVATIREELNRKIAYAILTLPIGRGEYYLGKFIGTLFATAINIAIMTTIFAVLLYLKFGIVWWTFGWLILFMSMEFAIVSSLVLLFSLSDSTVLAFSFTFFLYIMGNLADYVTHLLEEFGVSAINWIGKAAFLVIPNFSYFNVKVKILKDFAIPWTLFAWASAYTVLYIAVTVAIGIWLIKRMDL